MLRADSLERLCLGQGSFVKRDEETLVQLKSSAEFVDLIRQGERMTVSTPVPDLIVHPTGLESKSGRISEGG